MDTLSSEFFQIANEWAQLDERNKRRIEELKDDRKKAKDLRQAVMEYLDKQGIMACAILGGEEQITLNYSERKVKPKKPEIIRRMADFLHSKEQALKCYDFCFEPTEIEPGMSLSRKRILKAKSGRTEGPGRYQDE